MANPYFSHVSPFQPGTTVRADGVNAKFDAVEVSFEKVAADVDRQLRVHPDNTYGSLEIPNQNLANGLLFFDENNNVTVFSKLTYDQGVATAVTKAGEASASAGVASTKASEASSDAGIASTKAGEANASATAAFNYKESAKFYYEQTQALAGGAAPNSLKLGDQLPSFYATAQSVADITLNSLGGEPEFTKATAFNKAFGTGNSEVARGDHSHGNYTHANTLIGATVFDEINVTNGLITSLNSRALTAKDIGATDIVVHQNIATQTITRVAQTTEINTWDVTATYTLDESSFLVGDKIIVRKLYEGNTITIVTDEGDFFIAAASQGNTVTMDAGDAFTVEFHKIDLTNWIMRIY